MNTGAVGERITASKAGWLLHNADVTELIRLLTVASKPIEWQQKVDAVHRWQQDEGRIATTRRMGKQYLDVYRLADTHCSETSPLLTSIECSQEHA
ncbi:hypothetical protein [Oceanisphaera psychrotolerans]|uniref:Uncharacterized protein n=1 Tax=Oceanisphaera psychrotolerans TaxID=1414654 RepID=A0A1J4QHY3_9GAMM|nr:hypothetical protein [Oceanisphaera psychrotolerans]OIN12891.1 hypothetical protein BFR47_10925 [Oceanisphaera psychrotolerans]